MQRVVFDEHTCFTKDLHVHGDLRLAAVESPLHLPTTHGLVEHHIVLTNSRVGVVGLGSCVFDSFHQHLIIIVTNFTTIKRTNASDRIVIRDDTTVIVTLGVDGSTGEEATPPILAAQNIIMIPILRIKRSVVHAAALATVHSRL